MTDAQTASQSRITVSLTPKATAGLAALHARAGLSKTDLVNRALALYEFLDGQVRAGNDLIVRDGATGETQLVWFL